MDTLQSAPPSAPSGNRQLHWWAAAAGVVAVGTGVMAGELAAGLLSPSVSPLTAVGGAVIDAVPPGVKDWAISLFGTADKAALLGGMGLAIAALAALSGLLEVIGCGFRANAAENALSVHIPATGYIVFVAFSFISHNSSNS